MCGMFVVQFEVYPERREDREPACGESRDFVQDLAGLSPRRVIWSQALLAPSGFFCVLAHSILMVRFAYDLLRART